MKLFWLTLRFMKKQWFMYFLLIILVVVSCSSLTESFVYVSKLVDNVFSANTLPKHNAYVQNLYAYYDEDEVAKQYATQNHIEVGMVYTYLSTMEEESFPLAVYNSAFLKHYTPKLAQGSWFSETSNTESIPIVATSEFKSYLNQTVTLEINEKFVQATVIGILGNPTQFIYPTQTASKQAFATDSLVTNDQGFMVREEDLKSKGIAIVPNEFPKMVFLYTNGENIPPQFEKYGEIISFSEALSNFYMDTLSFIKAGLSSFIMNFLVVLFGLLSINVILERVYKKHFIIYYLVGMPWKKALLVEVVRLSVLFAILFSLALLSKNINGFYMLQWIPKQRMAILYATEAFYILFSLCSVSAVFIYKLAKQDVSVLLKSLLCGE